MEITIGFSAPTQLSDPINDEFCRYEYTIVLGGGTKQPSRVLRECLFYWPPGAARRSRVFERNGQTVLGSHAFRIQGYNIPLKSILRPNVSLISTLVQLGHSEAVVLRDIAKLISSNIFWALAEYHNSQVAQIYQSNPDLVVALNRNIQKLDLGILEVKVNKAEGQNFAQTTFLHDGLADLIPSHLESHGTRRFVGIFPTIAAALDSGGIAVVDEIDTSIHPHVLPEIIGWFYDRARNPRGAQLWFTAQNPYLLSSLAKEEVFFCEKNNIGSTTAFGLSSIKSVRRIDNYVNKYLGGVYGAVPHFG